MVAMIVDVTGVRPAPSLDAVREQLKAGRFFWLDVYAGDDSTRSLHLSELGLESTDVARALRFGQAGRMHIGRDKLRAVTWLAEPNGVLVEVHVICWRQCIMTVWSGDATTLDDIRQQFAERISGFESSLFHAAGILLQLLLGTLDHAVRDLDLVLDQMRMQLDKNSRSIDFALLTRRLQRLQSVVGSFDRYNSAVRSAIVGIEAVPDMDARGAAELNEYAEQVEDVEGQFYERRRWMSDMMHDYATAIAQRQGEQINRLTLVSLIFLPVTAVTGFFGMNFDWMNRALAGEGAFFILGVVLPLACVVMTVGWLSQRGLIQLAFWPFRRTKQAVNQGDGGLLSSASAVAGEAAARPELPQA